ncbi:MAG: prolipoprotein diacylglyceryl transferase [Patescibacteria group bacterium]|nr:prolipoprotein diacylglyceryl transferase [Patescibacteria group bacterium]
MFHFLHTFEPNAILWQWGPMTIYWYGLTMALAMLAGIGVAIWIVRWYKLSIELILDMAFWLIIWGMIGARVYYVLLEWPYYQNNLWDILKVWQGGLAIHGGIIAGWLALSSFAKRRETDFWLLTSIIVPAVALGQAIGRWGNYFNQELFGLPTTLSWGIPITAINRPAGYLEQQFFHPTFLYESIGTLLLFGFFCLAHYLTIKEPTERVINHKAIVLSYLIFYSVLRFVMEAFRIDEVPTFGVWRWPQIISLAMAVLALAGLLYVGYRKKHPRIIGQN